jgi:hypothetical protein
MRRRRQPAQTLVVAVVAMTTMLGALSMVVDAGVYFVLSRQLQNAADAAALAAVWYWPACDFTWSYSGNQYSPGSLGPPPIPATPATPATACQAVPNGPPVSDCSPTDGACIEANNVFEANKSVAASLCNGPLPPGSTSPIQVQADLDGPLLGNVQHVFRYRVAVSCNSPHWFARVLPNVCDLPACAVHISVSSEAALGWLGPNGELVGTMPAPPARLVARLIQ